MATHNLSRKKHNESRYLAEAQRASSIFPVGILIPHEEPDFLLHGDDGTIGIEVTELCLERPRAEAGRLAMVAEKAQERYQVYPNIQQVDVRAAFAPNVEHVGFRQLVSGLVDFILLYQHEKGGFSWHEKDLPDGYCYIGIHEPQPSAERWWITNAFDAPVASKELLDARIQAKNQLVHKYRAAAPAVWLLIVNDRFLGAGQVYARPDDLRNWQFVFEFDKVLLFSREASGGGEVSELQRA